MESAMMAMQGAVCST